MVDESDNVISGCCKGEMREWRLYREGCGTSEGVSISYTVHDPVCCPYAFLSTDCRSRMI